MDAWIPQENYLDVSNKGSREHLVNKQKTLSRLHPWKEKISVCHNFTTICAKLYSNQQFDFIYVDARHDYKGVTLDLIDWWPLLKEGGIMAGKHILHKRIELTKFLQVMISSIKIQLVRIIIFLFSS